MTLDYSLYPILYVDDEPANLVAVNYALESIFRILTASSGEEALRVLRENEDIAVLLCDQRMPGMTGVEVCEQARTIRPNAIRIIVTAYTDVHAAIDAINRGQIARYVTKPFRNEDLIEVIRTAIEFVHIQHTVRDMEVRLLQSGQATTARTIQADLAHELGNFIQSLNANIQAADDLVTGALQRMEQDPAHTRKLLNTAKESHTDAAAAVDQLTALVRRMRMGDAADIFPARSDAARVVDSTARILRTEIQRVARLQVVLEGSPTVPIDASALGQVVMNLLMNAAQAVSGQKRDEASITIRVGSDGERAKVSVADSGPGISPEHQGRIFDPYFTTKDTGNGLGLAIVRDIIQKAGGRIDVSSAPTRGTEFIVDLPVVTGSQPPPPI